MKYEIAFCEHVPHLETVEADDEHQALKKIFDLIYGNKTTEPLTGQACNHEIVNIRAENGDEFTFFQDGKGLQQWRWHGLGLTEYLKEKEGN